MEKEQRRDCVVSSVPRIGLQSFSKPTFKIKTGGFVCFGATPPFEGILRVSLADLSELFVNCDAWNCLENDLLCVFKWGTQSGLRKVRDQECSQIKRQNTYEDVKPKRYKKLWNLHWVLRTAWQKKQEGKQRQRTGDESAREMSVDGQDLTICGGCQGYMDFFSEVFCVVSFFFSSSLHFCTPRNTKMENIIKDWKKEQTLSVTFPNTCSVKTLVFLFLRAAFLNFDIWEGNSPSLVG